MYNRQRIMAGTETQIERIIAVRSVVRVRIEDRSPAEISPRYRFATPRRVRQGANYEHASLRIVMRENSRQVLANVWRLDIEKNGKNICVAKRKPKELIERGRCERALLKGNLRNLEDLKKIWAVEVTGTYVRTYVRDYCIYIRYIGGSVLIS